MKIGIYGRSTEKEDVPTVRRLFALLADADIEYAVESHYLSHLHASFDAGQPAVFGDAQELMDFQPDYVLSLGGDGTLLETLAYVKNTSLPVLGINFGRLGFLSNVPKEGMEEAISLLRNGHYRLEKRSLIELKSHDGLFKPFNFALNDFTIHKRDTGSMISIETYLNGEYFNTYWADGVIVSTPTGSTAYSLSCGGPIIFPDSNNFVITPVAPHNLNIRPIIVSDSTIISFRVKGRGSNHLISLDSRYEIIEHIKEIAIQKAAFFFNLVKLNNQNFIDTLREKLKWGLDNRNL
jgi:NAD+ kinase